MATRGALDQRVTEFVRDVTVAMGLSLDISLDQMEDGLRVSLTGADGELLLRRKGEALDALQHIVNSAFRRDVGHDRRLVIDCLDFRKGKDRELRQMAQYLVERVRLTGQAQEIGPLNSYARRLVHLEVAQFDDMASESQGDGAVKTVIISRRPGAARSTS
ncbi:MAG: hypothetical protein KJ066_10605 [Acidobacteria bacterium]|nr:hypothetical protein [Acidobacteriota bacterium]